MRKAIQTDQAPAAIGNYSQGIKIDNTLYLAGQIPLDPKTQNLVEGDIKAQTVQVFENIKAVIEASGGEINHVVKLTVYLMDLSQIAVINDVIAEYLEKPYPARTSIQVAGLPKGAAVEIDAMAIIPKQY